MDTVGSLGHGAPISIQGQPSRKEWRAVTENSGRDRLVADNHSGQAKIGTASRLRTNPGASRRSSRNGRLFNSGGSGHSSDSDHQPDDAGAAHLMAAAVPPQELIPHSMGGNEAVLYEKMQLAQQQNEQFRPSLSMAMDSAADTQGDALDKHILEVSRQREQLQSAEVELRARKIAHAEIVRMQADFDERSKQHSDFVADLQEQLHNRDEQIHQLEQQLEERERQLRANQMEANEAVWAKDGLLQQQTNELTTIRRERDNAVAEQKAVAQQFDEERADLVSQLEDLKEQIRQKERQSREVEEQHQNAQEVLAYKDEQLREAQAWIRQAQDLEAYHVNANNTLLAELRDRTDQLNNLWLINQRQLADAERYHTQTIQKLQLEISEAREQNRVLKGSSVSDQTDTEGSRSGEGDSRARAHSDAAIGGGGKTSKGLGSRGKSSSHHSGSVEGVQNVLEALPKVEIPAGQSLPAAQILSINPGFPPSGPVAMHQFGIHQQAVAPTLQPSPLQIAPVIGQLQPIPVVLPPKQPLTPAHHHQAIQTQHHQHQQQPVSAPLQRVSTFATQPTSLAHSVQPTTLREPAQPAGVEQPIAVPGRPTEHDQHLVHHPSSSGLKSQQPQPLQQPHSIPSQLAVSNVKEVGESANLSQQDRQDVPSPTQQNEQQQKPTVELPSGHQRLQRSGDLERQTHEQRKRVDDHQRLASQSARQSKQTSPKPSLRRDTSAESQQPHHQKGSIGIEHMGGRSPIVLPHQDSTSVPQQHQAFPSKSVSEAGDGPQTVLPSIKEQAAQSKSTDPVLLDERSLLACLVRSVPAEAAARIRVSTTLPNRLGKMLAPLHWHDYKKQYGRLDEFVASHDEFFVVDGDFIHLREGAREAISALIAVAGARAAAAAAPAEQLLSPVVAVTPVAQSQMLRGKGVKGFSQQKSVKSTTMSQQDDAQSMSTSGAGTALPPSSGSKHYVGSSVRGLPGNGNATHAYVENGVGLGYANFEYEGGGHKDTGASARVNGGPSTPARGSYESGSTNSYGNLPSGNGRNNGYFGNRHRHRKQDIHSRPAVPVTSTSN